MFRKSLLLVAAILTLVIGSGLTSQLYIAQGLPSAYDSGLTLDKAFKTAKTPLLIEFYTDSCGTCRKVTPLVHETAKGFKDRLTMVMVNLEDPENDGIAQLFGVTELPGVYVFDFKHMKKHQIPLKDLASQGRLEVALNRVIQGKS